MKTAQRCRSQEQGGEKTLERNLTSNALDKKKGPGGQQVGHESLVCPCSSEDQLWTRLHLWECNHQCVTASGVLCPVDPCIQAKVVIYGSKSRWLELTTYKERLKQLGFFNQKKRR
ncbi:hypothetical protein QYF61_002476 [Mycteria americana]|uniref:Uncharacterized protein n=1 Tax=Mycteria americana TaxID=33587 RepID=A0AAN7NQM2_MYCAM|nr:hypothetical protein QYF61_002476 [Mycteria americana]